MNLLFFYVRLHLFMCMSVLVFDLSRELARTYGPALVSFWGPASVSRPWGSRGRVQVLVALEAGPSASCAEINRAAKFTRTGCPAGLSCVHDCVCCRCVCLCKWRMSCSRLVWGWFPLHTFTPWQHWYTVYALIHPSHELMAVISSHVKAELLL